MPAPLTTRTEVAARQPIPAQSGPGTRPQDDPRHPEPRPGAAIAAAVNGARAARKTIAARETRTSSDLAAAVRDSASHWRTRPRQSRPRPSPRPAIGSYMTGWEHAFDSSHTLILGTGSAA
jgi:hypothetical protein